VGGAVAGVLARAVDALASSGMRVSAPPPPTTFDELWALHLDMVLAAVAYNLPEDGVPAATATHRGWLARAEDRARVRAVWSRWFGDHDVLLCPVAAMPAFAHDQDGDIGSRSLEIDGEVRPHMTTIGWCGLFSVLGLPSVVLPAGLTADGLPVGVQVVAPHGHDHVAVAFASAATTAIGAVIGGGDRNAVRSPPPRS
jgi:amidase